MPNKNYETGRKLEYLIVNTLKEHLPKSCDVIRSAGSHGADIVVVQSRRAVKIQAKSRKIKQSRLAQERRKLLRRIIPLVEDLRLSKDDRPFHNTKIPANISVKYSSHNNAIDEVLRLLEELLYEEEV
jgi:hypothetical protein